METYKEDLTTIDLDNNWKCYYQSENEEINDNIIVAAAQNVDADHRWSPVNLPHIIDLHKFQETNLHKWWYCKQFDWTSIDMQMQHRIQLIFESHHELNDAISMNITGIIWLNNTQLFSGVLMTALTNPIEFPSKLLISADNNEQKCNNTLVICCSNSTLCLHARFILHGKIICAAGQLNVDDRFTNKTKNPEQKENEILDYTVSLDDNSGRIDVMFKPKKKYRAPLRPEPSSPNLVEYDTNEDEQIDENKVDLIDDLLIPRLAIVILIVGTRGDVQPFIALGQALRAKGHRVRLATHEAFRSFVRGNGLEYYPLGGDPVDLISFMVKNTGIIPSMDSIIAGDVGKKRRSLADILASTWLACTANDDETNMPFTAEAIIANPPSFGHVHCAEKLQIPLHIMFTMPWTPTSAFPHPLSNIDNSTGSIKAVNRYSYDVIEMLTWTGLRDIINSFRRKTLGLSSLSTSQAINALVDERVPHTYCWSPSLVSKPNDWESHINVSGFFFLDLGTAYTNPPQDLLDFLRFNDNTNHKPIYIGFGSIAGHDSRRMLTVVVEALTRTGYRAILSGLASDTDHLPSSIFKVGNVPHDWLFQHVSAVCHHGGAGTTAAGLRAGKPTIIVPFFGDQFFWGTVIAKSGAGPRPIPGKSITTDELIEAFHFVHKSTTRTAAESLRDSILKEDGCAAAVYAFHANLPLKRMHSDLEPTFAACYHVDKYNIQISRPVAQVLVSSGVLEESQLRSHSTRDWHFKHDNHMHILTYGFFKHSQKAFSKMFIDPALEFKRTANNENSSNKALEGVGTVAKGIGLGLGHLTIGYLSLYGELTDILDHVPRLFDPYSNTKARPRPIVNDFKSGAKTAGLVLWNGWKDGVTGMIIQPRNGYQRHGVLGAAAGTLMSTMNICIKPGISTLSSITWLSRGVYASVKNVVENYKNEGRRISPNLLNASSSSLLNLTNDERQSRKEKEVSSNAKLASSISGFHPKVCQNIIDEFEKIKSEHEQRLNASSKNKQLVSFFRQNRTKRSSSVDQHINRLRQSKN